MISVHLKRDKLFSLFAFDFDPWKYSGILGEMMNNCGKMATDNYRERISP